MNKIKATVVPTALFFAALSLSLTTFSAMAHQGQHEKNKGVPIKMEQKEWGIAGDAKKVTRTIKLSMSDQMRFTPNKITVKEGETIRISLKNNGKLLHEMVIGTQKELAEHAALMVKFPNMEHDEPYMAHVPAGKTGEIIWTFNKPGEFDFACLVAGHYQAGMTGKIMVAANTAAAKGALPKPVAATIAASASPEIKPAEPTAPNTTAMTTGDIQKIDKETGKITIKHGEIKNLEMPAMTMVFRVKDGAMLSTVKVGDKISFAAEKINGSITVTKIEPVK